jgi:hypothetical protein
VTQAWAGSQARVNGAGGATPALRITALVHAAGAVIAALQPESWPWVAGMLGCNYLALGTAVFFPRSRLLGPNIVRLPEAAVRRGEVCVTLDDGPHPEFTPRVLDALPLLLDALQKRGLTPVSLPAGCADGRDA